MSSDEQELMRTTARALNVMDKVVLVVGYGMGIISKEIERLACRHQWVLEVNKYVIHYYADRQALARTTVLCDSWQGTGLREWSALFDVIYFDTYGERWQDFVPLAAQWLRDGGVFSFFCEHELDWQDSVLAEHHFTMTSRVEVLVGGSERRWVLVFRKQDR